MNKGQKIIPFLPMQREIWCHIYAAIFALLVVTPISVMLLDRRQPVELSNVRINPQGIKGDEEITVTYDAVVRRENCGGEVMRTIVDSSGRVTAFVGEPTVFNGSVLEVVGKKITFSKTFSLPRGLSAGKAQYVPLIYRWCNPLQRYLWPIRQSPQPIASFNVVP
jgi:hypothetical protein